MQFFIVLTVLITACTAYLLHQYWTGSLSDANGATPVNAADAEAEAQPGRLKAA